MNLKYQFSPSLLSSVNYLTQFSTKLPQLGWKQKNPRASFLHGHRYVLKIDWKAKEQCKLLHLECKLGSTLILFQSSSDYSFFMKYVQA